MSSLLGLLGSAAFALVAVYLASLVTVCHGPCGNKKDDVLYEMRSAACCSPSVQDCGNFLPGQGSTWLHGICKPTAPDFCNRLKVKSFFNGCSAAKDIADAVDNAVDNFFGR